MAHKPVTFLDELESPPEAHPAELVTSAKSISKSKAAELRGIEDEILQEATDVIMGALSFHKIDPASKDPPAEWVAKLGEERARERFRLAQYSMLNAKEAPVGLKMAGNVHSAIVKARSTEKAGARILNVALVQMPAISGTKYPEIEVGEEK